MKPELEDLSFVDLCRVEKALKDNFEKGLMVESTFTGMSEKIDLAKAGKISQNGKLVPVHIIDKNGKHTVKWKNPEDAGNHKKVSQGHKVTYKGESHTVHKVKKDGYWTLVDENGKKHDKSPLRLEVHKPGEMGDGKSEAPKEENHKTTMINIVDNAMVAGDGDPIKDKLKRGDVEGAIKQARKVAKIREKLGHSDEVERATDLRGIADELEKKFLNREPKKKEASEAPKRVAPNKRVTETKDMSLEQLEEKVGMFGKRDIPGFSAYTKSKALLDAFVKENSGKASPLLKKQYDTKFQMMSADRKTYIANLKKKVGEKPAQEAPKVKEPKKEEPKGDTAGELKSFLEKNKSHYASFLSPKRFSTSLNNDVLTIKPASGTFTIKVDTKNKTVETTGKPDFKSESTSYVEMMEGIKNRTKIKPENITDLSKNK